MYTTACSSSRDKVLIVEDNRAMSLLLSHILSSHFEVISFTNALPAFSYLKKNEPDILITDYLLPDLDGYGFVKNIYQNGLLPHIPIFMVTGLSPAQIPDDLDTFNVKEVIHKPFNPEMLVQKIFNVLETIRI
ncbi:MAG: response regulator [Cyclobacteriaceae bacterium]|nr:response regulator [Cyclobacteriaceae bacterium SS2]